MKLFELLPTAIKTQDLIVNKNTGYYIVYSKRYRCFIKCDNTGKSLLDRHGKPQKILLDGSIMDDDFYLMPFQCIKYETAKNTPIIFNNKVIGTVKSYNGNSVDYFLFVNCLNIETCSDNEIVAFNISFNIDNQRKNKTSSDIKQEI